MTLFIEVGNKGSAGFEEFRLDTTESVGNVFARIDSALSGMKHVNTQITLCDDVAEARTVIKIDVVGSEDDHFEIMDAAKRAATSSRLVSDN